MRSWLSLLALLAALPLHAQQASGPKPRVEVLVQSSPLAGFRYGEAAAVWSELRLGDALQMVREPDNASDPRAVRLEWQGRKLGYVPRRENAAVAWGLDRGTPLRARISRLEEHPNPRRRIEFEVYIE